MKTSVALAVLAVGAFAAPAADLNGQEHQNHLIPRTMFSCNGIKGVNQTCWNLYSADDIVENCRSNCSASIEMVNCLTAAGPVSDFAYLGAPRVWAGFPFFGTMNSSTYYFGTNASRLNNASQTCFKDSICPRVDNYASCFQCVLDHSNQTKAVSTDAVKYYNNDIVGLKSLCGGVGVTPSNHTEVVYSGARTTAAAGSLLLAVGVAIASCL